MTPYRSSATRRRAIAGVRTGSTSSWLGQVLLEPVVSIGLVVEGFYLAVSTASVELDGLAQGTVCLEPKNLRSRVPCVPLQFPQEPPSEPEPTCLWRHPHPLRLGRRARMKLECPTADGLLTQTGDKQGTGRWGQLLRIGGDAERWVEAGLEACVELGEIRAIVCLCGARLLATRP